MSMSARVNGFFIGKWKRNEFGKSDACYSFLDAGLLRALEVHRQLDRRCSAGDHRSSRLFHHAGAGTKSGACAERGSAPVGAFLPAARDLYLRLATPRLEKSQVRQIRMEYPGHWVWTSDWGLCHY